MRRCWGSWRARRAPARDTIYVHGNGSGDYTTIQAGIDAAVTGDEVVVASGTYSISDPITYDGKEIMLRSEYNAEDTIIDCQGVTNAVSSTARGTERSSSGSPSGTATPRTAARSVRRRRRADHLRTDHRELLG